MPKKVENGEPKLKTIELNDWGIILRDFDLADQELIREVEFNALEFNGQPVILKLLQEASCKTGWYWDGRVEEKKKNQLDHHAKEQELFEPAPPLVERLVAFMGFHRTKALGSGCGRRLFRHL